jgi:hypothetical protein
MPPLVDRELFFGNPEIAGAQISPDGKYIAFIKPLNDVRKRLGQGVNDSSIKPKPLTEEKEASHRRYFWSWDNKILFVKDNDGDENFNVYSVNPADAAARNSESDKFDELRKSADRDLRRSRIRAGFLYTSASTTATRLGTIYKVKISTGEKTLLRKNTDRFTGWVFDNDDKLRLANRSTDAGDTEILKVDGDKFTKIYSCNVFEICTPVRFHKDNRRVYMETNKGNTDLARLVLFDPETLREEPVEADPLNRVDFGSAVFSD